MVLDPRIHAYRPDIADIALAGQLFAPHYARPMPRSCGLIPTLLRDRPADEAEAVSQLLPGEEFAVLDITSGWAWGYCRHDHRVGYIEEIELVEPIAASHIVVEAEAPIQSGPDADAPSLASLPMGARLHGEERGGVLATSEGFVPLSHLRREGEYETDPVSVAQRLLGAPYLRGGRTRHGIDCSGLVQLALGLCGVPIPRDSSQQRLVGSPIEPDAPLTRGDLVFWGEHSGLMVDEHMVIHVGPKSGKVAVEPIAVGTGVEEARRLG